MVHELVRKLKAGGVGIFLITHDMPDVFGLSDRLAVMKNGKLVEAAPAEQLLSHPQHEYTRALLAAVPRLARAA